LLAGMTRILPFAAALLLAACGSSSTQSEALLGFCESLNAARIDQASRCGFPAVVPPAHACDGPVWAEAFDRVEQKRATFDAHVAGACLAEIRGSCNPFAYECNVLQGAVEPGGSCSGYNECGAGSECRFADTCPGTCVALRRVGESCSAFDCVETAFCSNGTCKPVVGEGGWCDGQLLVVYRAEPGFPPDPPKHPCAIGLSCLGNRCVSNASGEETEPLARKGEKCRDIDGFGARALCGGCHGCPG